ncbi:MAG: hypothetical protein NT075_28220 [Chloroflexi bacterium]|nr:hypothetical protein [Chloroflexota bacterium]
MPIVRFLEVRIRSLGLKNGKFVRFNRIAIMLLALGLIGIGLMACSASIFGTKNNNNTGGSTIATGPMTTATRPAITSTLPAFSHIFIIVMENKDEDALDNNPDAPYLTKLAAQYASADNFYGIRHPSLPNYMAMTGGDTFGIEHDCIDCFVNQDNLAAQLEVKGHSWKGYMESMPAPCFVGDALPLYKQKHNPFIYYDNIRKDPARCNKIVPLTQLEPDLQANTVPDFVWITPNLCNDTHDCPIKTGDQWLQIWVPKILASPAWQKGGVLFITYDEGKGDKGCCTVAVGGQVVTLVISPLVQPGFVSSVAYSHYSFLRTVEEAWGLPLLGYAGCDCTKPMTDFFVKKSP